MEHHTVNLDHVSTWAKIAAAAATALLTVKRVFMRGDVEQTPKPQSPVDRILSMLDELQRAGVTRDERTERMERTIERIDNGVNAMHSELATHTQLDDARFTRWERRWGAHDS